MRARTHIFKGERARRTRTPTIERNDGSTILQYCKLSGGLGTRPFFRRIKKKKEKKKSTQQRAYTQLMPAAYQRTQQDDVDCRRRKTASTGRAYNNGGRGSDLSTFHTIKNIVHFL